MGLFFNDSKWIIRPEYKAGILYDKIDDDRIIVNDAAAFIILAIQDQPHISTNQIVKLAKLRGISSSKTKQFLDTILSMGVILRSSLRSTYSGNRLEMKTFSNFPTEHLSSPMYLELYPLFTCNLQCKFCFIGSQMMETRKQMSFDQFRKIVNEALENKVLFLSLLGGEPLLLHWINDAINYAEKMKIRMEIVTNAYLLKKEVIDSLIDKSHVHLNISLHSVNPETYSYLTGGNVKRVLYNLKILRKCNVPFNVGVTITKVNGKLEEMRKLLLALKGFSVDNVSLKFFHTIGQGSKWTSLLSIKLQDFWLLSEQTREFGKTVGLNVNSVGSLYFIRSEPAIPQNHINKLLIAYCGGGIYKLDILPTLEVSPCVLLAQQDSNNYIVGNLEHDTLSNIWHNSTSLNIFRKRRLPDACYSCKYKKTCHGGCPALSLRSYTSVTRSDPRCPLN